MKFTVAFLLLAPTVVAFQTPRPNVSRALFSTVGGSEGKPPAPMTPPSSNDSRPSRKASVTSSTPMAGAAAAAAATTTSVSSNSPSDSGDSSSSPMPASLQEIKLPDMLSNVDLDSFKDKLPDLDNLVSSLQPDDGRSFGERGEIYVAGQAVLLLAVLAGGGIPFLSDGLSLLGPVLLLAGLSGIVLSVSDLGTSISPFTTPNPKGTGVQTKGIYQYVRHPMYTTLLASCVGWSLVTDSATRLILTALLVGVLNLKTDQEEAAMLAEFPEEYKAYQEQVTGKFFPLELVAEVKSKVLNK